MKLFNVYLPEDLNVSVFKPRIPEFRAKGEYGTIPRICLSSSLSGCISAVVLGGINFENMMVDIGTDYKSYPIKVYEFDSSDVKDGNLICQSSYTRKTLLGTQL